jgi:hydrogenase maturation protease
VTRVLVAGVGNLFFGDDGFGVEVARRLTDAAPAGTRVVDFGIRAVHLAYELLAPLDRLVVVDCMARGGVPGTLYVVEPDPASDTTPRADGHSMNVPGVFAMVRELGGTLPPTLVVGCEPENIEPGIGLSPRVAGTVPAAIDLIRELIASRQGLEGLT